MGSVIDYIDCPNCHHEAYNDYYYKSGEQYTICNNCGYYYSYVRGEKEYVETLIAKPYGYYRAETGTGGISGSLETEEDLNELLEAVSKDETIKIVKLSRHVNGEIILKEIYNRLKYLRTKKLTQINSI